MFSFSRPSYTTAIVVDVSSSSVGVAIVTAHEDGHNDVIWKHREYCLIHATPQPTEHIKQIKTSLVNTFLELSHTGLQALKEVDSQAKIEEVQAIFSAPWSHTITKSISLKDEHPFKITTDMIAELILSAKKQSKASLDENTRATALNLEITHGDVLDVSINEYSVSKPIDEEGRSVSIAYLETAIAKDVFDTLDDTVTKFFPKADLTAYSFMYTFYLTLKHMHPNTLEICLVNITGEATEIGIVRNGVLQHTTYAPFGTFTIAREIAQACKIPKEEAYSYMREGIEALTERLSRGALEKVQAVLGHYEEALAALLLQTGDTLTIPKSIFSHTDERTEELFLELLQVAAKKATGGSFMIHPVTAKVLNHKDETDTGLLISANFVAKKSGYMSFLPQDI